MNNNDSYRRASYQDAMRMAYLVTVTALFVIFAWILCAEVASTFLKTSTPTEPVTNHNDRPRQPVGTYG